MFLTRLCAPLRSGLSPRTVSSVVAWTVSPLGAHASLLHTATAQLDSNRTSVVRCGRQRYERLYPVMLVRPDGSTVTVRYKEPRRILMTNQTDERAERKKRADALKCVLTVKNEVVVPSWFTLVQTTVRWRYTAIPAASRKKTNTPMYRENIVLLSVLAEREMGYWDVPEGTDCVDKTWTTTKVGAALGLVGSAYHIVAFQPKTALAGVQRATTATVTMGVGGRAVTSSQTKIGLIKMLNSRLQTVVLKPMGDVKPLWEPSLAWRRVSVLRPVTLQMIR
ncbi:putative 39S ribosomal protein L55 mitochondrial [Scophthalmus maximus]|uniref:Putative 39S ribosomal protein L55 mitochondrial n=1 Tax=Scophthalmus maximus TaxID=52904 RepID=A0A2U9C557_SCOMX|nr:putative 39S ribosomal protein L55 mitochondrial [Scophthalmus maximus]